MIQRIQSLYLLLVAVLTGLMLLMPLGTFLGGTEEMYLTAYSTLAVSAWKLSAAAFFPPVSLIFTYLALRGIRKDILLVKSLDRIR